MILKPLAPRNLKIEYENGMSGPARIHLHVIELEKKSKRCRVIGMQTQAV